MGLAEGLITPRYVSLHGITLFLPLSSRSCCCGSLVLSVSPVSSLRCPWSMFPSLCPSLPVALFSFRCPRLCGLALLAPFLCGFLLSVFVFTFVCFPFESFPRSLPLALLLFSLSFSSLYLSPFSALFSLSFYRFPLSFLHISLHISPRSSNLSSLSLSFSLAPLSLSLFVPLVPLRSRLRRSSRYRIRFERSLSRATSPLHLCFASCSISSLSRISPFRPLWVMGSGCGGGGGNDK